MKILSTLFKIIVKLHTVKKRDFWVHKIITWKNVRMITALSQLHQNIQQTCPSTTWMLIFVKYP
jgi:hypothetical protein